MSSTSVTPLSVEHVRDLVATRTNKRGQHDHRITPVVNYAFHPNLVHMRRPDSEFTDDDLARRQRVRLRIDAECRAREQKMMNRWRRMAELDVVNPIVFRMNGDVVHIDSVRESPAEGHYHYKGEHFIWTVNTPVTDPAAPRGIESPWGRFVFNGHRIWPDHLEGDDYLEDTRMQRIANPRQ